MLTASSAKALLLLRAVSVSVRFEVSAASKLTSIASPVWMRVCSAVSKPAQVALTLSTAAVAVYRWAPLMASASALTMPVRVEAPFAVAL